MPAKILFICTGNTCRSSMAKALAQRWVAENAIGCDIEIISAGLAAWPGSPASKEAIQAMEEMGIDLTGHRAQAVSLDMLADSDLVLTMTMNQKKALAQQCPEHRGKIFTLSEYASDDAGKDYGDICDPFGQALDVYSGCARELQVLIEKALAKFIVAKGLK